MGKLRAEGPADLPDTLRPNSGVFIGRRSVERLSRGDAKEKGGISTRKEDTML